MRFVKDMKVDNGKRFWLVAWAGADDDGKAWEDSWEPTRNVDRKEGAVRQISVDPRPLDKLVQRTIAQCAMSELGATFGKVHETPILALSLLDLAKYFMATVAEKFQVEVGATTPLTMPLTVRGDYK